ncbi:MAG TPA: hypothetical protein VFM05_01385 [Candidatus Saccharimonadales bacterium]|nr:hypothetical protein [Candidatus Saccharimonadales bacterium]
MRNQSSKKNFVEFTVLWTDDDSMVKLAVKASSSVHATYQETYLYPDDLEEFATALKEFPRSSADEVVLECGSKDPKWYGYLRLRVFLLSRRGISALEVESEVREDPPVRAEAHFFISGMPADFNKMGSALIAWLADTRSPLRVEWKDDV